MPIDVQPERDRHGLAKSAHVAHVAWVEDFVMVFSDFLLLSSLPFTLLCMMSMFRVMMSALKPEDDRTRRKEEQSLEEGVRDEMEHPRRVRAHSHRRNHETKL